MAKFQVGQPVVFTSKHREGVGLSREVVAKVTSVQETASGQTLYNIEWSPTGAAMVKETELRAT